MQRPNPISVDSNHLFIVSRYDTSLRTLNSFQTQMGAVVLENVKSNKYLGVMLDDEIWKKFRFS